MKPTALDVCVCRPVRRTLDVERQSTAQEILDGTLTCSACRASIPISGGASRGLCQTGCTPASFGRQWNWFLHRAAGILKPARNVLRS